MVQGTYTYVSARLYARLMFYDRYKNLASTIASTNCRGCVLIVDLLSLNVVAIVLNVVANVVANFLFCMCCVECRGYVLNVEAKLVAMFLVYLLGISEV